MLTQAKIPATQSFGKTNRPIAFANKAASSGPGLCRRMWARRGTHTVTARPGKPPTACKPMETSRTLGTSKLFHALKGVVVRVPLSRKVSYNSPFRKRRFWLFVVLLPMKLFVVRKVSEVDEEGVDLVGFVDVVCLKAPCPAPRDRALPRRFFLKSALYFRSNLGRKKAGVSSNGRLDSVT